MKKNIVICVVLLIISFWLGRSLLDWVERGQAGNSSATLEEMAREYPKSYPDVVQELPEGFISRDEAEEGLAKVLSFTYSHGYYNYRDSEAYSIFRWSARDSGFMVIYNNEYYVNEEKFQEIAGQALSVYERHYKVYGIGDTMELRMREAAPGEEWPKAVVRHSFAITDVKRIAGDGAAAYEIKYAINPVADDETVLQLFDHVSTRLGIRRDNFTIIDGETVMVEVGRFERINMLALNVQEWFYLFPWQDTRKVRID